MVSTSSLQASLPPFLQVLVIEKLGLAKQTKNEQGQLWISDGIVQMCIESSVPLAVYVISDQRGIFKCRLQIVFDFVAVILHYVRFQKRVALRTPVCETYQHLVTILRLVELTLLNALCVDIII